MKQKPVGEFEFIDQLTAHLSKGSKVKIGAGDDAAVLERDRKTYSLLTCDVLVENIHFTKKTSPFKLGHKAMAVNISDIAAMGGLPEYAVASLGVSESFPTRFYKDLYRGMEKCAKAFGVSLVGGDTVSSPKELFINVSLTGWVEKKMCLLRKGARRGDAILVTGTLGGSIKKKHLEFTPRVKEARTLAQQFSISSMIDLSDGLAGDLPHILKQSRVGAQIFLDSIPISKQVSGKSKKKRILNALSDGEDYELLFTLPKKEVPSVLRTFSQNKKFPKVTQVGEIVSASKGIQYISSDGKVETFKVHGYQHF